MSDSLPLFYSCDIETLGLKVTDPIIEIGLCEVWNDIDAVDHIRLETHSVVVPLNPLSLSVQADTLKFHLRTPLGGELIYKALSLEHSPKSLRAAWANLIENFLGTLGSATPGPFAKVPWYFRGPHFDAAMIKYWLDDLQLPVPWKYYAVRDLRTALVAHNFVPEPRQCEHRAGSDAERQAIDLVGALRKTFGANPDNWRL